MSRCQGRAADVGEQVLNPRGGREQPGSDSDAGTFTGKALSARTDEQVFRQRGGRKRPGSDSDAGTFTGKARPCTQTEEVRLVDGT